MIQNIIWSREIAIGRLLQYRSDHRLDRFKSERQQYENLLRQLPNKTLAALVGQVLFGNNNVVVKIVDDGYQGGTTLSPAPVCPVARPYEPPS